VAANYPYLLGAMERALAGESFGMLPCPIYGHG